MWYSAAGSVVTLTLSLHRWRHSQRRAQQATKVPDWFASVPAALPGPDPSGWRISGKGLRTRLFVEGHGTFVMSTICGGERRASPRLRQSGSG